MKVSKYGFGFNDADYKVTNKSTGWKCPYYTKWRSMINRCYSPRYQSIKPSYIGDSVCDEWESFMAFKSWMEKQDWEGMELDKDLIDFGNKIYSPSKCCFIPRGVNGFIRTTSKSSNSGFVGVHMVSKGKFEAHFRNPVTKKIEHIGTYNDALTAHEDWRVEKLRVAKEMVESGVIGDERARAGLLGIFESKAWYSKNINIYRGKK